MNALLAQLGEKHNPKNCSFAGILAQLGERQLERRQSLSWKALL